MFVSWGSHAKEAHVHENNTDDPSVSEQPPEPALAVFIEQVDEVGLNFRQDFWPEAPNGDEAGERRRELGIVGRS